MTRQSLRRGFAGAVLVLALSVSGCAELGAANVDAAGMTQEEVAALPLERQFDLFGERYVRMQELMADAQRAISKRHWFGVSSGLDPRSGEPLPQAMDGATMENSYYLVTSRMLNIPSSTGKRTDLELMVTHFENQGWTTSVDETQTGNYRVQSKTDQGYLFEYRVKPGRVYTLILSSEVFWGNTSALTSAITDRVPEEPFVLEATPPGEYIPFPKWSDPILITDEDE